MAIDLTGQTFGKWTVLEWDEDGSKRDGYWWCRCACGALVSVRGKSLRLGRSKQCAKCNYGTPRAAENLIGRVFGKWTVVGDAPRNHVGDVFWLCRCVCGKERPVRAGSLRSGASSSCGVCVRTKKPGRPSKKGKTP